MFKSILIATDRCPLSEKAIETGFGLAKALGARATVVTVITSSIGAEFPLVASNPDTADYARVVEANADKLLAATVARAKDLGIDCTSEKRHHEQPWQAILDAAAQRGCDLIVMASHGWRGMTALLLGSETTKVLTHAKVPVLVCR
jgi:nucleotide-binding universal stress UspA family protein